jgi:predicted DNA binding CopG/RHH family protein
VLFCLSILHCCVITGELLLYNQIIKGVLKMPVNEKKRASNDRYNASCDYISLRPKKDVGMRIRAAASASGMSLQGYILQVVLERIEQEGK